MVPSTQVKSPDMVAVWEQSEAYQEYLGFIMAVGESIKGRTILSAGGQSSTCCQRLMELLNCLRDNIKKCPADEIQQRYGNPAYRDWINILEENVENLVSDVLGPTLAGAVLELSPYLLQSFGNKTRIDYGTGHEMNFVMFLCGLFKVGALEENDKSTIGLRIFSTYMNLVRDLQITYRMEPAGSMGVWNLDDYQFVSFIWGSAQLSVGSRLKPKSIPDPEMAQMMAKDNHLFACLSYIHSVKSGPFHEHSNQLWNISGVPGWPKVFTGLVKMYRAEVLAKFPVIQHTLFGSIFSLEKAQHKNPDIPENNDSIRPSITNPPGLYSPRPGVSPVLRPDITPISGPDLSPGSSIPPTIAQNQ